MCPTCLATEGAVGPFRERVRCDASSQWCQIGTYFPPNQEIWPNLATLLAAAQNQREAGLAVQFPVFTRTGAPSHGLCCVALGALQKSHWKYVNINLKQRVSAAVDS